MLTEWEKICTTKRGWSNEILNSWVTITLGNANNCSKLISYLLVFFIFDFGVLPLFNFCFPPDSMDLVSSSSLAGSSSYIKAKKMLLMNKFLDFYGIVMSFSWRHHANFQKYPFVCNNKPSTPNYFTIPKVKILKVTDNIASKFKESHCAFC